MAEPRKVTLIADVAGYIEGMDAAAEATKRFTASVQEAKAELMKSAAIDEETADRIVGSVVKSFGLKDAATVVRLLSA